MIPSVNDVLLQELPLVGSCCAAAAARLGALLRLKEESGLCDTLGEDGTFPYIWKGVAVAPEREEGGGEAAVVAVEEAAAAL